MVLRPDELSAEATRSRTKKNKDFITSAALGGTALYSGLSQKILPLLSEYVPFDLAMKGISKISPEIGNYLKQGQKMGLDVRDGMNFIKDTIQPDKSKDTRNIIEQYSPELYKFMKEEIGKGRKPIEAGALAEFQGMFKDPIQKMIKDHKMPWSKIVEDVFGMGKQGQPAPKQMQQAPKQMMQQAKPEMQAQAMQPQQQAQAMQPQQQGQPGPGQQALMAILQQIQQRGVQ